MKLEFPEGATSLDPDEIEGLIPSISTQAELNEFEAENILAGAKWARRSRIIRLNLLTDATLKALHKAMFGETWRWAGKYRSTEKSIGCEAWKIPTAIRNLTEDVAIWITAESYTTHEIAARFHHKLVWIHPFANGNGRFARMAADLLCEQNGWACSTWGASDLVVQSQVRQDYIRALQAADSNNLVPLIEFMAR